MQSPLGDGILRQRESYVANAEKGNLSRSAKKLEEKVV